MRLNYQTFGRRTGLRVSEFALGTGNFGTRWGHGAERDEARRIFDGYVEAGGNFLDSANSYQFGESEQLLGEFIAAERDRFVVATKYTFGTEPKAGVGRTGNGRRNMMLAVEDSLRRLKTDRIDLFWAHLADGMTPIDEIMRAFDDLVRAGKIVHAGLSNFPAWRVASAATLADLRGWAPLAGIQTEYSLVERTADRELLPMAEAFGLGATLWSPLGGGFLTGKYRATSDGAPASLEDSRLNRLKQLIHTETSARQTTVLDTVIEIAGEHDATPAHVAMAWLRAKAARSTTSLIPILGPRTRAQLDGTLGALDVTLDIDQIARLDAASAIALGTPHDMANERADALAGIDAKQLMRARVPVV